MTRRLALTLVAIGILAAAAAAAVPPFNTMQFYAEAEFAVAIRPYLAAVAQNPNDPDAHYWLGVAYLHAFRFFMQGLAPYARDFAPRAAAALERAVQLRPAFQPALLALLELYGLTGNWKKWAATLDRLMALNPPLPLR